MHLNFRTVLFFRIILPTVIWTVFCSGGLTAQYYFEYFGTNKVQYTHFDWRILETEHFEIYYYPEMRDLAERSAGMAEEQYRELQNRFNHSLKNKVPLIIYSSHLHFQQTNVTPWELPEGIGGFYEFFKGRVVLPSDGSSSHFRRVLRHELVHVFATSKINRILSDHRKFNHPGPPLWFTEGLAEIWSGAPDHQADMVMRDAVLNNSLLPVESFYQIEGSYLMYKYSESFLQYLISQYGETVILRIIENIWKSESFEKVIEVTVGKKYESLSREWHYDLKKRFYPELADGDLPSAKTKALTTKGFHTKPVYWQRDGTEEVYYVANRDGYTNIYRQPLQGGKPEVVIQGERSRDFESFHFFKSKMDISINGDLAFVTKSGEKDVLYLYNLREKKITHRYQYPSLSGIASPSFAPDGRALVFSGLDQAGNSDIYILKISDGSDDGELEQLTNDFYDDKEPAWHPDGRWIAFSSDRSPGGLNGYYHLYLFDLRERRLFSLTAGKTRNESPSWNNQGTLLAYTSIPQGGAANIHVIPFRQGKKILGEILLNDQLSENELADFYPRQVTRFVTAVFDPVWTKENDLIFTVFENVSFNIHYFKKTSAGWLDTARMVSKPYPVTNQFWDTPRVLMTDKNKRPYAKRYSLDFVQGSFQYDPIFGSGGGAQIGLTDMLGNDQYYFTVFNTGRNMDEIKTNWNFVITKVNLQRRTNFAYGVFRFRGNFLEIGDQGELEIVDENRYGGFFQVSYPLSRFERIETSFNASRYIRKQAFGSIMPVDAVLISQFAGYTFDNSLWGPSGPLDGERKSLRLGYTTDIYKSQQNYYTIIADYRRYFRITRRSAFAFRSMVQWNDGKNPQNFLLGGSWDLRGYPRWNIPGTRFFVINHELRYPLIDELNIRLPFGGFGFQSVRGAVFADLGNAWGGQFTDGEVILGHQKFDGILGSVGTGLRVNLFGFFVFRFDWGKMVDLRDYRLFGRLRLPGNRDRFLVTRYGDRRTEGFGGRRADGSLIESRRISKGIFFQFWFGWDY